MIAGVPLDTIGYLALAAGAITFTVWSARTPTRRELTDMRRRQLERLYEQQGVGRG